MVKMVTLEVCVGVGEGKGGGRGGSEGQGGYIGVGLVEIHWRVSGWKIGGIHGGALTQLLWDDSR